MLRATALKRQVSLSHGCGTRDATYAWGGARPKSGCHFTVGGESPA